MATLLEYKCPCCGGAIEFDAVSQNMKCPYCDNEFDMETLKAYDDDLQKSDNEEMEWNTEENAQEWDENETDNMSSYICESCGGEIVADDTVSATSCPYCGNPVIVKQMFSGMAKPNYVLPFKLTKEDAKKALLKHIKGKRLLPKFFKEDNHIDKITGVYVPFWLFDCETTADCSFKATKVRRWSDSNYNYTKTKHYMLNRKATMAFEKVPVDGSEKMDDIYMESIEPFNYNDLVDFQTAYLAGYVAEKYDIDADASSKRANSRISNSAFEAIRQTTSGYTTCVPTRKTIDLLQGNVNYALLPVWILNTKYKGKLYTFAMNAQTGKFVGELPVDMKRFFGHLFAFFGGFAVLGSIIATIFF